MTKKKKKTRINKKKTGLSKITNFTTKSLRSAFINIKKKKEIKKIKEKK